MEENNYLYEYFIKYKSNDYDVKLVITDKDITIEKQKGLFNKKYKPIESFLIKDIRMVNNRVRVKAKLTTVSVETKEKTYKFICKNVLDATKLTEDLFKLRTGSNIIKRTSKKVVKISTAITTAASAVSGAAYAAGKAIKYLHNNKEDLVNLINTIKESTKK